jgi:aminoglycoside phosphotransferase (APT) family kinase protein
MEKMDLERARAVLADWLAKKMPQARDLKVLGFAPPKAGNSAETVFVDISYTEDGAPKTEQLVVRRQYEGTDLFLNSDLRWQWDVLKAMASKPGTRVPGVVAIEMDRSVLGSPFYVMEKVEGRVVQQHPNYNQHGWLAEAPVELRAKTWTSAIQAIAQIHKLDWRDGFQFMDDPKRGAPGLDQYLHYVEEWFHWAAAGREQPVADAALAWLKKNKPADAQVGVLWGDAIPANMLFAPDGSVAAVIDWEMAALGPGETDLGWWLFFDAMFSDGYGVPRLEGLPDRAQLIEIYEAAAGRKVENIDYYEILAMVRLGIISVRQFDRQMGFGKLTPGSMAYVNNPIQAMIARKLGLPVPDVGADFAEMVAAATGR